MAFDWEKHKRVFGLGDNKSINKYKNNHKNNPKNNHKNKYKNNYEKNYTLWDYIKNKM